MRIIGLPRSRRFAIATWAIDHSLGLHPVDALPASALVARCPEQLIDTVILRNLKTLSEFLFGQASQFVFHSTEYWGEFDIGCVLDDGNLACIENKGRSFNRVGLAKFLDDIHSVGQDPHAYATTRFSHVVQHSDEYIWTARRMYAGFFLKLRCDTQPHARELASEAADFRGVPRQQFESEFQTRLDWLNEVSGHTELSACLLSAGRKPCVSGLLPLLLITSSCKSRVTRWLADYNIPDQAWMGTYQFYADAKSYPCYMTMEAPVRMTSLKDG